MEYRIDGDIWYGGADESDGDYCGKDCYWRIEDGVLKIRGSGDLVWGKRSGGKVKTPNEHRGMRYRRVVIGDKIKSINEFAFKDQPIREAEIAGNVGTVTQWAFWGCRKLRRVRLKSGMTAIGQYAFCQCDRLSEITMPEGAEEIGEGAFWLCKSLKSMTMAEGVRKIGMRAFWGCERLRRIIIPSSVSEIGDCAFGACSSLKRVIFCGTKDEWERMVIGKGNKELRRV